MSLRHAMLVALLDKEGTGYEIAKQFDGSLGHFWNATHQQIYKELGKLADEGLVAFKQIAQADKPTKKLYRVTTAGRVALIEWLRQPTETSAVKEPLLVKLYAGYLLKPEELLAALERERAQHRIQLQVYLEIEKNHFATPKALSRRHRYAYFTLRNGIYFERAWLKWAGEVIETLTNEA
jgi:DNA-binding PadR family transcriptional regulator